MHSPAHSYSSKHSWSPRTSSSGLAVDHQPTRLRKSTTSVLSICIWALGLSVSICVLGQYHLHPSKSTAARSQRFQRKYTTIESAGRMLQELPSLRKQQHSASNDKSGTSSNHAAAQASETTGITGAERLEAETTQRYPKVEGHQKDPHKSSKEYQTSLGCDRHKFHFWMKI